MRGQYNQSYFDEIKAIVRLCDRYGIYVLLDMHQDSWNERLCGEGAPDWAVDTRGSFERLGMPLPQSVAGFPMPLSYRPFETDSRGHPNFADCERFDCGCACQLFACVTAMGCRDSIGLLHLCPIVLPSKPPIHTQGASTS